MTGITHGLVAAIIGGGTLYATGASPEEWVLGTFCTVAGGLAPDFDHPSSLSARSLGIFTRGPSWIINRAFGHRGALHSIFAGGLTGLLLLWVLTIFSASTYIPIMAHLPSLVFAGWLSHLALDWMTPAGIPAFWPITDRRFRSRLRLRTGSVWEIVVVIATGLVTWWTILPRVTA